MALSVVGRPVSRNDGYRKVTGLTKYGYDISMSHMLHGKVLRSPIAYGRITKIDLGEAKKLSGVEAVLTGKDLPYTYGNMIKDRPILASEIVRYYGEPIVAVAAINEEIAEQAIELIKVEFEEYKPLLDPYDAMKDDSRLIHENLENYQRNPKFTIIPKSNICNHYKLRKGDVNNGFSEADVIVEGKYYSQMVQQAYIEPHVAVAYADSRTKDMTIWTPCCNPYAVRKEIANAFGIPISKVRIIVPEVGGSFGGKAYTKCEPIAIALSMVTGRTVRHALDREEVFNTVVRGPAHIEIKSGVKNDGTIVARKITTLWDTGAYAECGPMISRNAGHTSAGPYRIPNIQIDGYCVYTNKNVGGAFRGYGVQELTWAMESHMNDVAKELKMDPYDFRKKNILLYGDQGATGQIIDSTGLEECLDIAYDAITRVEKPIVGDNKFVGRGIASMHKASMTPSFSAAVIKLNEDGTATLLTSTIEQGQGSETVFSQIISEIIGLKSYDITVSRPDTDYTPYDTTTTASRSTFSMGNAVEKAAHDIQRQLKKTASYIMGIDVEQIGFEFGHFVNRDDTTQKMTAKEIVKKKYPAGGTFIGRGEYEPHAIAEDSETGQSPSMTPFWMYGAQAAEVIVDLDTGEVTITKIVAAHDVGKAINPLNCKQQIEGALAQGVGQAIFEEVKLNENGKTMNPNLHDYKLATAMDMPEMEVFLVESIQHDGPFGAKGVGEPALAATAPAVRNAIMDAVGVSINDLPLTPERVLKAIQNKKSNDYSRR